MIYSHLPLKSKMKNHLLSAYSFPVPVLDHEYFNNVPTLAGGDISWYLIPALANDWFQRLLANPWVRCHFSDE